LPNGLPCGVPTRWGAAARKFGSKRLERTENPEVWLYDGTVELRAVPRPRFYDLVTSDGTPFYKIALLHGDSTLATTVYQSCRYWMQGAQCRFCTIPTSLYSDETILEKSPEHIAEVLTAAENEGVAKNLLLTTGTPDTPDMGIDRIVAIAQRVREFSNIPIGVQFEPPTPVDVIDRVAAAGVNAVGIHIESADDRVRAQMCPGKHDYGPLDLYRRSWERAARLFERGNVSTFILHGLGEDSRLTLAMVEELAEMGVLPVVSPVRPAMGSRLAHYTPTYVARLDESVSLYKSIGTILFTNGLDPGATLAGCHHCGGCTPIKEAYDWAAEVT
jgi:radical SAM protein (TIGR04043 family)